MVFTHEFFTYATTFITHLYALCCDIIIIFLTWNTLSSVRSILVDRLCCCTLSFDAAMFSTFLRWKVAPDFWEAHAKAYNELSNINSFPCDVAGQTHNSEKNPNLNDLAVEDIEDKDLETDSSVPTEATPNKDEDIVAFVTDLVRTLLTKCRTREIWTKDDFDLYVTDLVNQTLQGLTISEGFSLDDERIDAICKAGIKDLTKRFGGRRKLESVILSRQQSVSAAIIECLQTYIKVCIKKSAEELFV